jgi:hypothetical protein
VALSIVECSTPKEEHLTMNSFPQTPSDPNASTPDTLIHADEGQTAELVVYRDADHRCFAVVEGRSYRIDSKDFRSLVLYRILGRDGRPAAVDEANAYIELLHARAFSARVETTYLRVARQDATLYVDLANPLGQAVEIDAKGWRVTDDSPIRFSRPRGTEAMATPVSPGDYRLLRRFIRLPEPAFLLLVAQLTYNFREGEPMPIMVFGGEQGSAKSTAAKMVQMLCDPRHPAVRQVPASRRDLMVAATHAYLLSYDNVSELKPWLSDALCTLATGGGYGVRANHTDAEEITFDARRPVVLGGISNFIARDDLRDRTVCYELDPIGPEQRVPEGALWKEFREAAPVILGGLFDLCAGALALVNEMKAPTLPRMADFYLWALAVEKAAGWPSGTIERAYHDQRALGDAEAMEADLVLAIIRFLDVHSQWSGTASELLHALKALPTASGLQLPRNAAKLGSELRRIFPLLRRNGIEAGTPTRSAAARRITLARVVPSLPSSSSRAEDGQSPASSTSAPSAPSPAGVDEVSGDSNDSNDGPDGAAFTSPRLDLSGFDVDEKPSTPSAVPAVTAAARVDEVELAAVRPARFRPLFRVLRGRELGVAEVFAELQRQGETQFATAAYVGEELARGAKAGVFRRVARAIYTC